MADVKISELPALTTVLTTALLAVVSAGTTYKATVDDLFEALPLDGSTLSNSDTGLKVATGGITANELATGAVDLATAKVTGLLPHANIANGSARSVFGRAANSSGVMAPIAGAGANTVLVDDGTTLSFVALGLATLPNIATDSLLGRDAAGTGAVEVISLNATLSMTGSGALQRSALTGDVTAAAGSNATTIANDAVTTAKILNANVTLAKIADLPGLSVAGRSANTSGVMAAITGTDGQALRVSGTTLGFGQLNLGTAATFTGTLPATRGGTGYSGAGGTANRVFVTTDGTTPVWGVVDLASAQVSGLLPLASIADGSACSLFGRSANTSGPQASIAAGTNGFVFLRRTNAVTAALLLDENVDAAAAIAGTKVNPNFGTQNIVSGSGATLSLGLNPATSGDIKLRSLATIQFRDAANAANVLGLSIGSSDEIRVGNTGAVGYQQSATNHDFRVGGTSVLTVDADSVDLGAGMVAVRFAAAAVSPVIQQLSDSTTAVTGDQFQLNAQDVTGTGATVGGILFARAGNSTNGTGGGVDLRSGTGATATQAGIFNLRIGSTVFWSYPGTVIPATSTGILRAHHNATVINARDSGNANNRNLVRWGVTANDVATFGDSAVATEVLGSTVQVGDSTTMLEVANLTTNREIISLLLGAALTTTEMPANTGDKVVFWAYATTEPTTGNPVGGVAAWTSAAGLRSKGALGGFWDVAPNTRMHRQFFSGFVETSSTTLTTILSIDTSGMGADVSAICEVYVTCVDTVGQAAQKHTFTFNRQNGTLSSPSSLTLNGGSAAQGTVTAEASAANILIRITAADTVNYRWDAMAVVTYGNIDNAAA